MTRVLVTGSRDWPSPDAVHAALDAAHPTVVVHGACPTGADAYANAWAQAHGTPVEAHPADWRAMGKAAGPIRNAYMVNLGADQCLAFVYRESRGATHCARLADLAGIPTTITRLP